MKWLVLLDPINGLVSKTDTSLALIRQARSEGIGVDIATIDRLYVNGQAMAMADDAAGSSNSVALDDYSCIFMRKEPPYDLAFHYATQILSLTSTPVVNSPQALRDYNEKLIALNFSQFMPPTLVSSSTAVIDTFVQHSGRCVLKELDTFQGRSVRTVDAGDFAAYEIATENGQRPVMVQQFQERVYEGDKRVLLLGGKFFGAVLRKPKEGYHANFANSDALKTELAAREQQIIETVGPWLVERGMYFVGLDLIGGQLTEINITCPTGIVQISGLEGRNLAAEMVAYFRELTEK